MDRAIEVENLVKWYGSGESRTHALRDVTFSVDAGEMVSITGPSGCGKSTLLSIVGHVTAPTAGVVLVRGKEMTRADDRSLAAFRNSTFGYLLQEFALLERDSVLENVELPLRYRRGRVGKVARRRMVGEILERLGVARYVDRRVADLSGGERQRVALARALITDPPILLADEPTGALDSENAAAVFQLLRKQADEGRTVMVVTHDTEMAALCDRQIAMRDGHVVESRDERGDGDGLSTASRETNEAVRPR
ncbi:ABC transporter ATP-binding protein [Promicromonospora sp. NFX87]|jgi:putative ABC transport system ATP-binding protein|uniref:ABC transporter ATP-binding protein n=1 Tax=Promicromonospora sp. NFX87 TaxID=3402691 RepID=UPI003AFA220E